MLLYFRLFLPGHEVGLICGGFVSIQPSVANLIAINQSKSIHKCRIQVVRIKLIIEILAFINVLFFGKV